MNDFRSSVVELRREVRRGLSAARLGRRIAVAIGAGQTDFIVFLSRPALATARPLVVILVGRLVVGQFVPRAGP